MTSALTTALITTLTVSPIIAILLLVTPVLDKKYSAKGRYWLWLILALCLLTPNLSKTAKLIELPLPEDVYSRLMTAGAVKAEDSAAAAYLPKAEDIRTGIAEYDLTMTVPGEFLPETDDYAAPQGALIAETGVSNVSKRNALPFSPLGFIAFIWLAGIVLSFIYYMAGHLAFTSSVRRWSKNVYDGGILSIFRQCSAEIGVPTVRLRYCKKISVPMITGFIKPVLLLPCYEYDGDELRLIFRHELIHYKRRDLWYKLLMVAVRCMYWFNPLVRLMARQADKDLEIICDLEVVRDADIMTKKRYSEIILAAANASFAANSALTTCMWNRPRRGGQGGNDTMKIRFTNIFNSNSKNRGVAAFGVMCAACALIFIAGKTVGFRQGESAALTDEGYIEEANIIAETISENIDWLELADNSRHQDAVRNAVQRAYDEINVQLTDMLINYSWPSAELLLQQFVETYTETTTSGTAKPDYYIYKEKKITLEELKAMLYPEAKLVRREFDNITAINLDLSSDNVIISRGGDKVSVKYYEWLDGEYELSTKAYDGGNELKLACSYIEWVINKGESVSWMSGGTSVDTLVYDSGKTVDPDYPKNYNRTIEITVPYGVSLSGIDIDGSSGNIEFLDIDVDSVNIDTGSGSVSMTDCRIALPDINTGSGSVRFINSHADEVRFNAGSGALTVDGSQVGTVKLSAGSGAATLKDSAVNNVKISVGSGKATVSGGSADTVNLSSGSGTLLVDSSKVAEISASTGSGSIVINKPSGLENAKLSAASGSAAVNLTDKAEDYKISLTSINGTLTINGDIIGSGNIASTIGSPNKQIQFSSTTGSLTVNGAK